jgi:ABC-type Fe3+/spermidine/putrescine transport system ATPase subunit
LTNLRNSSKEKEATPLSLKIENVSKAWREFQLKNINLTMENGDYFIILGPTGAGKTLLLETLMGFHNPDNGKILLNGKDLTDVLPEKRGIGYVSQNCILFPHLTVRQNIEFGLKMGRIKKTERQKMIEATLESTGLKSIENRRPQTLSGGEKQKVALARVLALAPSTILLDEPLSALDAETARDLKNELNRIHKNGKTIIHVTHNQIEGFSLGNKMAIMHLGEVVQTGKTRDVFSEPQSEFVARFLGYENVFKVQMVEKNDFFSLVQAGVVKLKVSGTMATENCYVAIRPEDITVSLSLIEKNVGLNVLEGKILDCVEQGYVVTLTLDAGLEFQAIMIKNSFLEANLAEGKKVWFAFKNASVKVIK